MNPRPTQAPAGQQLGPYRLLQSIARDPLFETLVAAGPRPEGGAQLVLLKRGSEALRNPELQPRLLAALRLGQSVAHANLLRVVEVGAAEGAPFVACAHVPGVTLFELRQLLVAESRPVPLRVAVCVARDVARGLHAVHTTTASTGARRSILHGMVRPRSIWIDVDGVARLADLGAAQTLYLLARVPGAALPVTDGYSAPELLQGESLDVSSDQFSLGVVLWELLARRALFTVADPKETAQRVLRQTVDLLVTAVDDCPPEIDGIVQRMLSRKPAGRFRDCDALATALDAFLQRSGGAAEPEVADFVRGVAGPTISARTPVLAQGPLGTPPRSAPARTPTARSAPAMAAARPAQVAAPVEELPLDALQPVDAAPAIEALPPDALQALDATPARATPTPAAAPAAPPTSSTRTVAVPPSGPPPPAAVGGFCSSCGAAQHAGARFCHRCGASIHQPQAALDPIASSAAPPAPASLPPEERVLAAPRADGHGVQVDRTTTGAAIVMEGGMRFVEFDDTSDEVELELSVDRVGPGSSLADPPLRGRHAELEAVRGVLDSAGTGRAQLLLLLADAGMGKSRLLKEAAAMAGERSFSLARASGGRFGVPVSLDVFRQWVVGLCEQCGDRKQRGERAHGSLVSEALSWVKSPALPGPLVRRLEQLFDGTGHQVSTNALDMRQRQLGTLMQFMQLMAEHNPICLLVDDLHLADELSVRLVSELAQRLPGHAVATIATAESSSSQRLPEAGARLNLPPLAADECVLLAESFLRVGALPTRLVPVLRDGARGNPLLVAAQMRTLLEAQALTYQTPDWALEDINPALIVTQARDVTRGLCEPLLPGVVHTLRMAAMMGHSFSRSMLEKACVGQGVDVNNAIDEAMGRGLLVSLGQSRQWQSFAQASTRVHLLEGIPEASLRKVHGAMAAACERCDELPRGLVQELVARHLVLAGANDKAMPYIAAAAQSLFERGLPEQAAELIIQLLRLTLPELRSNVSEAASALLLQQCTLATRALRQIDPARASGILASLLDRLPREHAPVERARALRYRALAQVAQDRPREAEASLETALRLLPEGSSDPVVRAMVQADRAALQARLGAVQEAASQLAAALQVIGDSSLRSVESGAERLGCMGRGFLELSGIYARAGRHDYAQQAAKRGRDLARRAGQSHLELRSLLHLAASELDAGNLQSAGEVIEQARALADADADLVLLARTDLAQARLLHTQLQPRLEALVTRSGLRRASLERTYAALCAAGLDASTPPPRQGALPPSPGAPLGNMAFDPAALREATDLDPETRKRVLYYAANVEHWNHFELFGLGSSAGDAELRTAYFKASKLFHPDNYFRKNLGSFQPRVERVFKAMKEAYAVLSDAKQRTAYEATLVWQLVPELHAELMDLGALRGRVELLLTTAAQRARLAGERDTLQAALQRAQELRPVATA